MDSHYTNGSYTTPYPPAAPHYTALPQTRTYSCSGPSYSTDSTAPYRPPPPAPPWGCGTQDCPAEGCSLRRQQPAGYSPPQVRHHEAPLWSIWGVHGTARAPELPHRGRTCTAHLCRVQMVSKPNRLALRALGKTWNCPFLQGALRSWGVEQKADSSASAGALPRADWHRVVVLGVTWD